MPGFVTRQGRGPPASTVEVVPVTSAQVKPVIDAPGPGLTPTSPLIVDVGTSLMPAALNRANGLAVSSGTVTGADDAALLTNVSGTSIAMVQIVRPLIVDPSSVAPKCPMVGGGRRPPSMRGA
jgi:hypothetical protein